MCQGQTTDERLAPHLIFLILIFTVGTKSLLGSVIAFGLGNGVGGLGVEINFGITYIIVQKNVQVGLVYGRLRMMRKTGQKTTRNNIKMYIDHIRDLTPPVIQFQNIELVRTRDQEGEVFGIELEKRNIFNIN